MSTPNSHLTLVSAAFVHPPKGKFIIPNIMELDLDTGELVLHSKPNKAAAAFWDAVKKIAQKDFQK